MTMNSHTHHTTALRRRATALRRRPAL